jgi:hypothetical protein
VERALLRYAVARLFAGDDGKGGTGATATCVRATAWEAVASPGADGWTGRIPRESRGFSRSEIQAGRRGRPPTYDRVGRRPCRAGLELAHGGRSHRHLTCQFVLVPHLQLARHAGPVDAVRVADRVEHQPQATVSPSPPRRVDGRSGPPIYAANHGVYGARKVALALNRQGIAVARCTVERLMRKFGSRGVVRGKARRPRSLTNTRPGPTDPSSAGSAGWPATTNAILKFPKASSCGPLSPA